MNITYKTKDLKSTRPVARTAASSPRTPIKSTARTGNSRWKNMKPFQRIVIGVIFGYLIALLGLYIFGDAETKSSLSFFLGNTGGAKVIYPTYTVTLDNSLPGIFKQKFQEELDKISHEGKKKFTFTEADKSDYVITVLNQEEAAKESNDIKKLYTSYFVPVGHFYWIKDGVSKDDLKRQVFTTPGNKELVSRAIADFTGATANIVEKEDLPGSLKGNEGALGVIDLGELNQNYKLLQLDGKYFLDTAPEGGVLYQVGIKKNKANNMNGSEFITSKVNTVLPAQFTKDDLLTLNMTGVTAIVRGLAIKTNASGRGDYAADKIGEFLKNADLTHVSNEISFVDGCRPAGGVSFCSHPNYMQALEKSGVDIVELTGNHNNDYGWTWNQKTINMYKEKGWDYFGGGLNAEDASKILYKDVKGTKIAFLGYNYYDSVVLGGTGALASNTRSGANPWSANKMKADIAKARENGAQVVIVTYQYQECYAYTPGNTICYGAVSVPDQKRDFKMAIDYGADMVVGTQAHQAQTYEIYKDKPIFYGLGNLYFDQIQWLGTRQGLVLTHYFLKGRYITTKISTTIYDSDLRTYVTTGTERDRLLKALSNARR
jgi:hypothetical protein